VTFKDYVRQINLKKKFADKGGNMNIAHVKKFSRLFFLMVFFSIIMGTPGVYSEENKSQVKMSWQEFRQLLKLDTEEITLTWDEFKQLVAQTGEDIRISYSVKNGKIVLPREQFTRLLDRMKPPQTTVPSAPTEYVISKAVYNASMGEKSTILTALFSLEIFGRKGEKYFQVPILPQTAGLAEVFLDDQPALVIEKNGWYHVTTAETGHHQIKAKYYISSDLEKGPTILNLNVIKTAITLLALSIPLEKIDVSVPNAKELSITQKNGITKLSAIIPASHNISIQAHRKYTREEEPSKAVPAKIYAETINLISIEEDALRVTSRIKLNVLQNSITHIKAMMPEGYNILYINKRDGSRIRDWQITKTDNSSIVEIPFDAPVQGSFIFDILSEQLFVSKQPQIHFNGFRIFDATRETGYIGAEKKSTAEAAPTTFEKLDRIDIKDLPYELVSMSQRPLLFGYRYLRHPFHLGMSITRHEELPTMGTVIDLASVITVALEDGKTLTRLNYTIRNTWKQFLKLELPPDSEVWTVYVASKRENASRNAEGKIMIPLARSQSKGEELQSFTVDVIYFSKGDPLGSWGNNSLRFPSADIMISKMLWSVYLPQDYSYLHFKGNVEKEEIARTVNLLLGKRRNFSLDQVGSYNEVAGNLEKAPQQQQVMNEYQQSLQSYFRNKAIGQKDIANQMRQEANLNLHFQREQGKRLGQPGSGSNIFKIELPTSGQIYRFNKTIIEGEPIELTFYYASNTIIITIKIFILLIMLLILFLLRKKIYALLKHLYHWVAARRTAWEFLRTTSGLRITLFVTAVIFLLISHFLFVVLVLLFILSVFRPNWLLPDKDKKIPAVKVAEEGEKPGEKDDDKKLAGADDKEKETGKKG
jgi:hypothetical protein